MCVNRLWAALPVSMVFDRVHDASGAFIAASRAVAALVLGSVALREVSGCCPLTVFVFLRCAGWIFATGLVNVVGGVYDLVSCAPSSFSVSGTLGSVALKCTLENVAFLFCLGTVGCSLH